MYFINAASPPGNCGICFTLRYTWSCLSVVATAISARKRMVIKDYNRSLYCRLVVNLRFNRGDGEGAGAVNGGETVLLQRTGAPTVDAAHTTVFAVKGEDGEC